MNEFIKQLLKRTEKIKKRYNELGELIYAPEIIAHNSLYRKYVMERASVEQVVLTHDELTKCITDIDKCKNDLTKVTDSEIKDLLNDEINNLQNKINALTDKLKLLLLPKNKDDNKDVVLEITAQENRTDSAIFALNLLKMYELYAKKQNFDFQIADFSYDENGGLRYCSVEISGLGAYEKLKNENGLHKATGLPLSLLLKASSANAFVSALPQAEDIEVNINNKDIRIDLFHSGGAGGQNVNKVQTAVRITHLATGIVVTCQDERSQLKNKQRAMKILKAKVFDYYKNQTTQRTKNAKMKNKKQTIRSYNYSTNIVTDNRINISQTLDSVLSGNIDAFIDGILIKEREKQLAKIIY